MHHRNAFTLIELLVVVAIISILSIVVVLTLNPAQLLMQGRDSDRISDMASMNSVLGIYAAQGGTSFGSSNVVYVSIPDPSATSTAGDQCQGLGLPSLPATYSYHCAPSSTYRAVNGSGWIPINFSALAAGSPLGTLPQDPVNTSSSRLYYTYDTNGTQYEVTSVLESQKYSLGGSNDVISNDGGILASVYEKGSTTGLEPLDYGDPTLVGWWNFNEGTGTVAYDYSGNNATGTWSGTLINGSHYTSGKIGSWAGNFDGSSDFVSGAANWNNSAITIIAWVNEASAPSTYTQIAGDSTGQGALFINPSNNIFFQLHFSSAGNVSSGNIPIGTGWNCFVGTWSSGGKLMIYENGSLVTQSGSSFTDTITLGSGFWLGRYNAGTYFPGLLDDVRIYNRALTAGQIAAMYNGGK